MYANYNNGKAQKGSQESSKESKEGCTKKEVIPPEAIILLAWERLRAKIAFPATWRGFAFNRGLRATSSCRD
ncbi:MAG: hypothetical protein A3A30_02470 [Candidatus Terrybacteria bacterium RIFCSPLOWO2_01_FULL_48_14]|nr:MAG: hypothetical protein A3A30_02470 [Candidatus Terrybacteria bacterium RIFCSPLOWO2_01_FULL_48_14]